MAEAEGRSIVELLHGTLLFYAVIFLTCMVGIIELLPEIDGSMKIVNCPCLTLEGKLLTALYFVLTLGLNFSISRCFNLYRRMVSYIAEGHAGEVMRNFQTNNVGIVRHFLSPYIEAIVIVVNVVFLIMLYFVRIGVI